MLVTVDNIDDELFPENSIASIIPQQAWMGDVDEDPDNARDRVAPDGYPIFRIRKPTEMDEHLQDAQLTVFLPDGCGAKGRAVGKIGGINEALLSEWITGDSEDDVVTDEQYPGMPVGIRKDSFELHAGGGMFRLMDWRMIAEGNDESGISPTVIGKVIEHPGVAWFKAEGDKYRDGATGEITDDLLSLCYLGRPQLTGESPDESSSGIILSGQNEEGLNAIQVRAYHAGGSIDDGSYGQISRVGGEWVVSAVYC